MTPPARGFVVRFCSTLWIGRGWGNGPGGRKTVRTVRSARVFPTAYEAQQYAHYGPVYSVAAARELELERTA